MRVFVTISLLCFLLAVLAAKLVASETPPDFRVTIIAVTQFDDPKLSGPEDQDLNTANAEAANNLKTYFEGLKAPVDLYFLRGDTTQDSLRTWLFQDLPYDSRKGVHLVFVLTHGFAQPGPDVNGNKSELFLATSDTYKDIIPGKALRGGDFIDAFQDMPSRATVFLFLDTCGSGAIDSENLRKVLVREPEFASRVMILAAANSDEDAYRARFTRALLSLWQSKNPPHVCGEANISRFLTESLKNVPDVSPDVKQTVRVVAPLSPYFCIDSFSQTQRFLMLYNGAQGDISVTVQPSDQSDPGTTIDPLRPGDMAPVSQLRPGRYLVIAKRKPGGDQADNSANVVKTVDLTSIPADVEVFFSADALDNAKASQAAAHYLDSRGILPSVSEVLKEESSGTAHVASQKLAVQQQRLKEEHASLVNDANHAEAREFHAQVAMELAQRILNEAKARMNQAHSLESKSALKSEVEQAGARLIVATLALQRSEQEQARVTRNYAQVHEEEARVVRNMFRFEELKKSANDYETKRAELRAIERSASTDLKSVFPDVQVNSRGVVANLTNINMKEVIKSERVRRFVAISNKYPTLNVEVELLQGGSSSIKNYVASRARAAALRRELVALGLKSQNVVARGFTIPGMRSSTISFILSPR